MAGLLIILFTETYGLQLVKLGFGSVQAVVFELKEAQRVTLETLHELRF